MELKSYLASLEREKASLLLHKRKGLDWVESEIARVRAELGLDEPEAAKPKAPVKKAVARKPKSDK